MAEEKKVFATTLDHQPDSVLLVDEAFTFGHVSNSMLSWMLPITLKSCSHSSSYWW